MKVVFAEEALQNLDEILAYTAIHYPTVFGALVVRLKSVIARVAEWPDSAQGVAGRPGVRSCLSSDTLTRSFTERLKRPSRFSTFITRRGMSDRCEPSAPQRARSIVAQRPSL